MKIILYILSGILLVGCTNETNAIKPEFYSRYFAGLESTSPTSYDTAVLNYNLTQANGSGLHIENCSEVEKLKESDIAEDEYHLLIMLKINCKALQAYFKAKSARTSYLDELLTQQNISQLPADVYPNPEDHIQSDRQHKNLMQDHPELKFTTLEDGAVEASTSTDDLIYQIIATGDFNHDGILDAIIRVDWHTIGAFGQGSMMALVTRTASNSQITTLNQY